VPLESVIVTVAVFVESVSADAVSVTTALVGTVAGAE
jgi:hypothetical protein